MSTAARGWHAFRVYLEMIKFEHSIFALPFAMIGMMWASRAQFGTPWPGWRTFAWIVVAMVSCRSAAMAYNRIADRRIDALNPRTQARALPAGLLSLQQASLFFLASCFLFFVAAWALNPLAFALSPLALGITLFYSYTKRFTSLSHFVLGLSLGIAPAAAWIAVTGALHPAILAMTVAVMLWTAGFDIIYSLQDEEFDREQGLRSLPQRIGKKYSLWVSRASHALAVVFLTIGASLSGSGAVFVVGIALAAILLVYEHGLVKPDDLSRVNVAFFTVNGFLAVALFVFALADEIYPIGRPGRSRASSLAHSEIVTQPS